MKLLIEKIKAPTRILPDGTRIFKTKFGREYIEKKTNWFSFVGGVDFANPCGEIELPLPDICIIPMPAGIGKTWNLFDSVFSLTKIDDIFIVDYPSKLR